MVGAADSQGDNVIPLGTRQVLPIRVWAKDHSFGSGPGSGPGGTGLGAGHKVHVVLVMCGAQGARGAVGACTVSNLLRSTVLHGIEGYGTARHNTAWRSMARDKTWHSMS